MLSRSENPHSSFSFKSDLVDLKALFLNDLDIENANRLLLNKYVIYQISNAANRNEAF